MKIGSHCWRRFDDRSHKNGEVSSTGLAAWGDELFAGECGDDGCGGSCGTCPGAAPICDAGLCTPDVCTADCLGKACGDDGCGGQVMGWVVMSGIIGGVYLISSALGFPILLIPCTACRFAGTLTLRLPGKLFSPTTKLIH